MNEQGNEREELCLTQALSSVDDRFIEEAADPQKVLGKKPLTRFRIQKTGLIAACLILSVAVLAAVPVIWRISKPIGTSDDETSEASTSPATTFINAGELSEENCPEIAEPTYPWFTTTTAAWAHATTTTTAAFTHVTTTTAATRPMYTTTTTAALSVFTTTTVDPEARPDEFYEVPGTDQTVPWIRLTCGDGTSAEVAFDFETETLCAVRNFDGDGKDILDIRLLFEHFDFYGKTVKILGKGFFDSCQGISMLILPPSVETIEDVECSLDKRVQIGLPFSEGKSEIYEYFTSRGYDVLY